MHSWKPEMSTQRSRFKRWAYDNDYFITSSSSFIQLALQLDFFLLLPFPRQNSLRKVKKHDAVVGLTKILLQFNKNKVKKIYRMTFILLPVDSYYLLLFLLLFVLRCFNCFVRFFTFSYSSLRLNSKAMRRTWSTWSRPYLLMCPPTAPTTTSMSTSTWPLLHLLQPRLHRSRPPQLPSRHPLPLPSPRFSHALAHLGAQASLHRHHWNERASMRSALRYEWSSCFEHYGYKIYSW